MQHEPLGRLVANHPFADIPAAPVTLGTGYAFKERPASEPISPALMLALVADMIRADPEVAHSLARQVGYEKFVEPLDIAKPFPLSFHYSELSISDRGEPKTGTKPSRAPARYRATLKFAKVQGQVIRDIWSADFDLYDPKRWSKKLDDLCSPTKCRTPLTPADRLWNEQMIAAARETGFLLGLGYVKPRAHGGTHYIPRHVLFVSPDLNEAFMLAETDGGTCKVAVPPFSTLLADGRALPGKFIVQSRGVVRTRELKPTHTGYVEVIR